MLGASPGEVGGCVCTSCLVRRLFIQPLASAVLHLPSLSHGNSQPSRSPLPSFRCKANHFSQLVGAFWHHLGFDKGPSPELYEDTGLHLFIFSDSNVWSHLLAHFASLVVIFFKGHKGLIPYLNNK